MKRVVPALVLASVALLVFGCGTRKQATSLPGLTAATAPKVNVVTLVVNRSTMQSLDFGSGGQVDTGALGPGLPLRLP